MSSWTGMRGVQAAVGGPSQRTLSRRANKAAAVCPNSGLTAKRSRAARIMVLEHARWVPGTLNDAPASGRWQTHLRPPCRIRQIRPPVYVAGSLPCSICLPAEAPAEACPTKAGKRGAVVGHALACPGSSACPTGDGAGGYDTYSHWSLMPRASMVRAVARSRVEIGRAAAWG